MDNDTRLWGKEWGGIPICTPMDVQKRYKDSIVVIAVAEQRQQAAIYHQLIHEGVKEADILIPQEGYLYCGKAGQYFDLEAIYPRSDEEAFVDAGCFDGQTSLGYGKMCKGRLRIYALEPDHSNHQECDRRLSQSGYSYELYECAAWSGESTLRFSSVESERYASRVSQDGDRSVQADSIDNILKGRRATYIKYDVEGSELEALKGSMRTIREYRPRLAISVYHKPEDIIEIPALLEDLDLGYRYYLRHYQTRMQETILYAV